MEETIERAVGNQHELLELFYGNGLLLGFGFFGFWIVWFGLVFLSNEVHEPVACIIF